MLQLGSCADPSIRRYTMYVCVGAVLMGGVLVLGVSWRSVSAHKKEGLREAEGSVLSRNLDTATQKWGGQAKAANILCVG